MHQLSSLPLSSFFFLDYGQEGREEVQEGMIGREYSGTESQQQLRQRQSFIAASKSASFTSLFLVEKTPTQKAPKTEVRVFLQN